jgi:cardiolipin synthase
VAVVALMAGGVLLHRISDVVRGRPLEALALADGPGGAPAVLSASFLETTAALTGVAFAPGHSIQVLADRAVFDAMLADLAAATRSITFSTYFCHAGRLAERFARVLAERARAGVRVLFLVDDHGCSPALPQMRPQLDAAGVEIAVLRPVGWFTLDRAQHRNHARMVVVDGTVAYTGGFGLSDEWSGEASVAWRDTSVRFEGPAVRALQAAFLTGWAEATGILVGGAAFFPPPVEPAPGDATAGLLFSAPGLGTTPAERALALSIAGARRTLFITNSYFVPPPFLLRQLTDAAGRGVDVRLLLPGPIVDHATTRWAGRGYYDELLGAGVRIFEYRETMLHPKTLVADGVWAWVGTLNLDNRSMRLNDEDALLVHDGEIGAALETHFAADLDRAEEITRASHRARSFRERVRERITLLIAPLL